MMIFLFFFFWFLLYPHFVVITDNEILIRFSHWFLLLSLCRRKRRCHPSRVWICWDTFFSEPIVDIFLYTHTMTMIETMSITYNICIFDQNIGEQYCCLCTSCSKKKSSFFVQNYASPPEVKKLKRFDI